MNMPKVQFNFKVLFAKRIGQQALILDSKVKQELERVP